MEIFERDVTTLSNLNSGSYNLDGLNQLATILTTRFKKRNFEVTWDADSRSWSASRPVKNSHHRKIPKVLLLTHMDTVFDVTDPFQSIARVPSNDLRYLRAKRWAPLLTGPGVVDNKAGIVMIEQVLDAFRDFDEQIEWKIFIQADEEIGSRHSKENLIGFAKDVELALVFEPGWYDFEAQQYRLASEVGGNISAQVVVNSPASTQALATGFGRGAADVLSKFIGRLNSLRAPNLFVSVFDIDLKSKPNVTASFATAKVSIRFERESQRTQILNRLKQLTVASSQIQLETKEVWNPLEISTPQVRALVRRSSRDEKLGVLHPTSSLFRSGAYFLAQAGIPTIDGMGPIGGDYHSSKEWLALGSCHERLRLVTRIIQNALKL